MKGRNFLESLLGRCKGMPNVEPGRKSSIKKDWSGLSLRRWINITALSCYAMCRLATGTYSLVWEPSCKETHAHLTWIVTRISAVLPLNRVQNTAFMECMPDLPAILGCCVRFGPVVSLFTLHILQLVCFRLKVERADLMSLLLSLGRR
jgi:hypothetical protein